MLDKERYLALGVDILEHQLLEGRESSPDLSSSILRSNAWFDHRGVEEETEGAERRVPGCWVYLQGE